MRSGLSGSMLVVRMVKVDTIVSRSRMQTRKFVFDPDKYPEDLELMNSIKEQGVIEPLIVRKLNKDPLNPQFALMAGDRRLSAAAYLQLPEVPARIMEVDEDNADLKTVAENSGRRELDSYESAMILENLLKSHSDWKLGDVEKATGWSQSKVNRIYHAYFDSGPELRGLLASGMPANRVLDLQPVFKAVSKKYHQELAERVFQFSKEDIVSLSNFVKDNPKADPFSFIDATLNNEQTSEEPVEQQVEYGEETPEYAQQQEVAAPPAKNETIEYNDSVVELISYVTGASIKTVKMVMDVAQAEGCNNKNVILATCLFIQNGGDVESSFWLTQMAMANKKSAKLIKQFVGMQVQLANSIESIDKTDTKIGEYIRVLFGKGAK